MNQSHYFTIEPSDVKKGGLWGNSFLSEDGKAKKAIYFKDLNLYFPDNSTLASFHDFVGRVLAMPEGTPECPRVGMIEGEEA